MKVSGRDRGADSRADLGVDGRPGGVESHETLQQCLGKLVQLLPQVARGLRRTTLPPTGAGTRLGPRHGVALSLLSSRGPLTVGQLAAELGLTLPTVSGIVADVELAGFVRRAPDPADRRRTVVSLAPQQDRALGAWLRETTAPMERTLDKLSPDERAAFVKAMTYLQAELDSGADACPAAPPCPQTETLAATPRDAGTGAETAP